VSLKLVEQLQNDYGERTYILAHHGASIVGRETFRGNVEAPRQAKMWGIRRVVESSWMANEKENGGGNGFSMDTGAAIEPVVRLSAQLGLRRR